MQRRHPDALRWLGSLATLLVLMGTATPAAAHEVGLSRAEYTLRGKVVQAHFVFSQREIAGGIPGIDPNGDEVLDEAEVAAGKVALEQRLVQRLVVRGDGQECPGALQQAVSGDQDGLAIDATYTCPSRPAKLTFEAQMLDTMSYGHRHVAHIEAGGPPIDVIAHRRQSSFEVDTGPDTAPEPQGFGEIAASFFVTGIEHILLGPDHLAFLFGLILLGGRARPLIKMITAFTVAHSISLALAVLGIWAPSPSMVEPAIAASVAYVGVENWFVKDGDKRWRLTFPFGLIHGFGFAGALGQIDLPSAQVPVALLTFNLGVEAGQLGMLAVTLPLVLYLRKRDWFRERGVKVLSGAVALAGAVWLVERLWGVFSA